MAAKLDVEDVHHLENEAEVATEPIKTEVLVETAKKMMGREFQQVLGALMGMLPGYEDMLVMPTVCLLLLPCEISE